MAKIMRDNSNKYPKVFCIILNWNGLKDTIECIKSVLNIKYPNYKVLVVDNGSSDHSAENIYKLFPEVVLIENSENLGYAEGNNVGIRNALSLGADYIWLLNNDTTVDRNALTSMVAIAEKIPMGGIFGSKIYYYSNPTTIDFAGATINWKYAISPHIGQGEIDKGQYDSVKEIQRANGCSMLIKKEVFETVGLLDSKMFLYAEEVEYCVRAEKNKYKTYYVPESKVYHKISKSTGENSEPIFAYYNTRNFLYLIKKNMTFPYREIYLAAVIFNKLLQNKGTVCRMILQKYLKEVRIDFKDTAPLIGIYHFIIGRMGKGYLENTL